MSSVFCQECGAAVEGMAGACENGHRIDQPTTLDALRAEVDRAFEDAAVQVAQVLTPPPPPPGFPFRAPTGPVSARSDATSGAAAVPVAVHHVPAPAPILTAPALASSPAWSSLPAADPIAEFAPPPRIDWGPDRTSTLKRRWPRLRAR